MHTHTSTTASSTTGTGGGHRFRWRVIDIVIASVLGVAAGLVFLLWNIAYLGPMSSSSMRPSLPRRWP